MRLVEAVPKGAVVGLDTSPFIYVMEENPEFQPIVSAFFRERLQPGLNRAVTSVITLSEVLVKPLSSGDNELAGNYRDMLFTGPH